jgi:arylsulfatase A-like enzyme
LRLGFPNPATDSRVPDIIVQPELGVIYSNSTSKDEEHGGFSVDDTNVALLLAVPTIQPEVNQTTVQTTQIAPTILRVLGLDPAELQAVQQQRTPVLPGFDQD